MEAINYPGKVCLFLSDYIKTNPLYLSKSWKYIFVGALFFLCFSTLLNSISEFRHKRTTVVSTILSSTTYILVFLLSLTILRIPNLILPVQNVDESNWIVGAASFVKGAIFWKTLNGNTSGPMIYAPLSVMTLGDGLNYTAIRLFGLIFCVVPTIFFLWRTLLALHNQPVAMLTTLPLFVIISAANTSDLIAYNSEHIPMLLTSTCIYLYVHLQQSDKLQMKLLIPLGFLIGASPYAKLQAVPIFAVISILSLVSIFTVKTKSDKEKHKALICFAFSVVAPSVVVATYLSVYNCWEDFFTRYILDNILYTKEGLSVMGGNAPAHGFSKFLLFPLIFKSLVGNRWGIVAIVMLFAVVIPLLRFKARFINTLIHNKQTIPSLLIASATYLSVVAPGNNFGHYMILALAPITLVVGEMISVSLYLKGSKKQTLFWIFFYLSSIFLYAVNLGYHERMKGFNFVICDGGSYPLSDLGETIQKYTTPNEKMSVWGWGDNFYIEAGLIQANSSSTPFHTIINPQRHRNLEKYVQEMEVNKPAVFLDLVSEGSFGFNKDQFKHENYPQLNDHIQKNYVLIGKFKQGRLYVSNDRMKGKT